MDIKSLDAANAYNAALGKTAGGTAAGDASAFAGFVENAIGNTADSIANAEAISARAVAGQADLVDVVTAVSNAEMTLNTVTTVRDRVISAYQEIMRMPI